MAPSAAGSGIISALTRALSSSTASARACLPDVCLADRRASKYCALSLGSRPSSGGTSYSFFCTPTFATSSSCRSQISPMIRCASLSAASMTSSGNSRAKPSIIRIASLLPETIKSRSLSSKSSCVGNGTNLPSTRPKRTEAIGPSNGKGEMDSAAEAPFMASTSASFCRSLATTKACTCTSSRYHEGNSGRMGRSISRLVSVSFIVGRPSRFKKPPGNLPAAAVRSR